MENKDKKERLKIYTCAVVYFAENDAPATYKVHILNNDDICIGENETESIEELVKDICTDVAEYTRSDEHMVIDFVFNEPDHVTVNFGKADGEGNTVDHAWRERPLTETERG